MPFGGAFFPKIVESKVIYANAVTITSATLTANIVSGSAAFYLSADDGANWEQVTNGGLHTFTNTGTRLKYRVVLNKGTSIDNIEVAY